MSKLAVPIICILEGHVSFKKTAFLDTSRGRRLYSRTAGSRRGGPLPPSWWSSIVMIEVGERGLEMRWIS
jgi:hypothetical protein